jgi:hypothetical protein
MLCSGGKIGSRSCDYVAGKVGGWRNIPAPATREAGNIWHPQPKAMTAEVDGDQKQRRRSPMSDDTAEDEATKDNLDVAKQNHLNMFEMWKEYEHTAVHFKLIVRGQDNAFALRTSAPAWTLNRNAVRSTRFLR